MMTSGSVLVFGGGRGIGLAVAESFVDNGFGVTIAARTSEQIDAAVKSLSKKGPVQGCVADVAEFGLVREVIDAHIRKFGEVNTVINAAALQGPIGCVWDTDPDEWQKTVLVNMVGSFHVCRAALPAMIKQNSGTLIFFSGGGAANARPHFSAYAASKTGVLRLVETVNEELLETQSDVSASSGVEEQGNSGVRVYAIAPGAVHTRMTDEVLSSRQSAGIRASEEALKTRREGGVPPSKAAELCLFLAGERPRSLSGKLIHVNEPYREYAGSLKNRTPDSHHRGLLRRVPF